MPKPASQPDTLEPPDPAATPAAPEASPSEAAEPPPAEPAPAEPPPAEPAPECTRLSELPDWHYLLREFYNFYRNMSAGGSQHIRAHQRAVRSAARQVIRSDPQVLPLAPSERQVTTHLRRALNNGRQTQHASIIDAIDAVSHTLSWQIGYERPPKGLERKFAYAEFAGPSGPVITNQVILGIVLFAPGCTYPAHAHPGITESYICLSGAVSENHQGVYGPGSMIFNPPGHMHRITVSDWEPALLGYAWSGPPQELAKQKLVISRPGARKRPAK